MADTITDEYGYPFDSLNGDRKMSAASWRKMLGELFTDGICSTDDFYVQANNSMHITVSSGNAFIRGAFFPSSEEKTLNIDSSEGTYDRYDAITLEFNASERKVSLKVVKGGTDGKWPSPKRTDSIYQLFIAIIHVRKGITSLVQNDVNDTRGDSWYCGYVTSTGSQERIETELATLKDKISELEEGRKWSSTVTLGTVNGITFRYRYNHDYVYLIYGGSFSVDTGFSAGTGYSPGDGDLPNLIGGVGNFLEPVASYSSNSLAIRYYPSGSTSNKLALISIDQKTVSKGTYITGFVLIPRNLGK